MKQRIKMGGQSKDMKSRRSREEAINCFLETDENGDFIRLSRTPGFRTISTIGTGPIRAMYTTSSVLYVVSGNEFYRVTVSAFGGVNPVKKGNISGFTGPASMDAIGTDEPQIQILTSGTGYIYNEATDVFTEITDASYTPDLVVTSFNQRFWLNKPGSNEFFGSDILDGLNYDALFFASADNTPDTLKGVQSLNTEIYMFGTRSIERWQDIGVSVGFPLRRMQGATLNRGISTIWSLAKFENSLFFLADDYTVRKISFGGQMDKVSSLALELAISTYSSPEAAIGFVVDYPYYKCYCITFPGNNATWCYDILRGTWHKRDSFGVDGWRIGSSVNFQNMVLLGDKFNGNLYMMDGNTYTEGGEPSTMTWITTSMNVNEAPMTYSALELIADMGVGSISNVTAIGQILNSPVEPTLSYARSTDGGFNWRGLPDRTLGAVGNRMNKIVWRDQVRVPRTNDLVHKFSCSGDHPVNIYSAYIDGDPGLV